MDHDVENPGKTDVRKAATVHYPGETGKRGKEAIRGFSTNVGPGSSGGLGSSQSTRGSLSNFDRGLSRG
jgi:hypothetical protein